MFKSKSGQLDYMSSNYAVLDIGTLKVKFLIAASLPSGELKEVYFSNNLTCFGCNLDETGGYITEKNLQKTIEEILRCKQILKTYEVIKTRVVSTHALRNAKNREEVSKTIEARTGFKIDNISQDEEALLFFKAVMRGFSADNKQYAVVDVGGGSVQILLGSKNELKMVYQLPTGAQLLHENFTQRPHLAESFTTEEDIEKMRRYILEQLTPIQNNLKTPIIYGSSCIIDLMKTLGIPLSSHSASKTHPYQTYIHALDEFVKKILPLTYAEREIKYPFQKGYLWGIDKAFLNICVLAQKLASPCIIPSNANIAQGIIYGLAE